jgi:hypothetical protein
VDAWQAVDPENAVTGVAFQHGGGWWSGRRDAVGYRLQHAAHWAFEGTGLGDGDVLGADPAYPLVGYEADGAPYVVRHGIAVPTGESRTPPDFFILGLAELGPGWVAAGPRPAATLGLYTTPGGGVVFQAATTDWPILAARDPAVARVTRNVLERLRLPSVRIVGPLPARGGRARAVEGERATFHADPARLPGSEALALTWTVTGAERVGGAGPLLEVAMPSPPRPVTVTVTAHRDGAPAGFGTATLLPLGRDEALKHETLVLLREMVVPSAPEKPLVEASRDPADALGLLYGVRIPWIRERAARLRDVTGRLIGPGPEEGRPR